MYKWALTNVFTMSNKLEDNTPYQSDLLFAVTPARLLFSHCAVGDRGVLITS